MDKITEFANKHRLSITTSTRWGFVTISIKWTKIPRWKTVKLSLDDTFEEMLDARLQEKEQQLEKKKWNDKKKKEKIKKEKKEWTFEEKITIKEVDDIFSKYIRLKYWPRCYTCGSTSNIGNWHCVTRMCNELRRDEDNCRPQCFRKCNSKESGNGKRVDFEANLIRDWVDFDRIRRLETLHAQWKSKRPNQVELKELYDFWKNKYNLLQLERK